ncbi:sulfurtransferase [Candidatus Methanocrinis natronophilus]|uniref:sulfurtransferase n=1 Tax=Candidatus Methanocrinis natronophilus TaxID=3033396 RepID=UPI00293442C6|nr:rhodanese-like domain-containing protein [Candidatus Methanocrinis natronophilus]
MLSILGAVLAIAATLTAAAAPGCSSCVGGGSGGTWSSGLAFIGASAEATTRIDTASMTSATGSAGDMRPSSMIIARSLYEDQLGDNRYVMAYVGAPGDESYIEGSIHLPLDPEVFNPDGTLKSPEEIAAIFGAAGISEDDPLVIYGDSFVNGYDTFAFWVMKYLGHQDVLLLEGTKGGRQAAGLKFAANPSSRDPVTYNPDPNLDLLALPGELEGLQLVDARTQADYNAGHLEGAINIDYTRVRGSNGLATSQALAQAFSGLDKNQKVAVSSINGGLASIVWYALYSQGYQGSLLMSG